MVAHAMGRCAHGGRHRRRRGMDLRWVVRHPPWPDYAPDMTTGREAAETPVALMVTPSPTGVDECWAIDAYRRPPDGLTEVAQLFTAAKYHHMGPAMSALLERYTSSVAAVAGFRRWPSDLVVVPVSSSSKVTWELAKSAAQQLRVPLVEMFRPPVGAKVKGIPLVGHLAAAMVRLRLKRGRPSPHAVLLIDDLVESGSTLAAASALLRSVGAERVIAIVAVSLHR